MYTVVSLNGSEGYFSMQDIDIAHGVPARKAASRPNPIIWKFVARQIKKRVMAARKEVSKFAPSMLGYGVEVSLSRLGIYDHLSPLNQALLSEVKKGALNSVGQSKVQYSLG